jgi:surface antigen
MKRYISILLIVLVTASSIIGILTEVEASKKLTRNEAKNILISKNPIRSINWCVFPGKCPNKTFHLTNVYGFSLEALDASIKVSRKTLSSYLTCLENKNLVRYAGKARKSKGSFSWESWSEISGSGEPFNLTELGQKYLTKKNKFVIKFDIDKITGIKFREEETVAIVFFNAAAKSSDNPFNKCFEDYFDLQSLLNKPRAIFELFDDGWRLEEWNAGGILREKERASPKQTKEEDVHAEEPIKADNYGQITKNIPLTREAASEVLKTSTYFPRYQIFNLPIGQSVNVDVLIKTATAADKDMGQELNVGYGCAQRLGHLSFIGKQRNIFGTKFAPLYKVSVTDEGMKHGSVINKESFGYAQQYAYRIYRNNVYKVTGIRLIGKTTADVEFIYRADDIGEIAKCVHPNITPDKTENVGRATFVLFDDGWRIESVKVKGRYTAWVTLTERDRQELLIERKAVSQKKESRTKSNKDIVQSSIDVNSKYYTSDNPYYNSGYGGQCTAFAWGRAYEKVGIKLQFKKMLGDPICGRTHFSSAKCWFDPGPEAFLRLRKGTNIQADSIAVWDGNERYPYGHVAYVERVENGHVFFNEANFDNFENTDYGGGYIGHEQKMEIKEFENRSARNIGKFSGYLYLNNNSYTTSKQTDQSEPQTLEQAVEESVEKLVDGIFKGLFRK